MTQEERLDMLKRVACGLAKVMGNDTEVVLHDLTRGEVAYIANGHVTGRAVGYKINPSVYKAVIKRIDADDHLIGYGSQSSSGKNLRASHFVFRDEAGEPCAMLCINEDTSKYEEMLRFLQSKIQLRPIADEDGGADEVFDENYIQRMTQQAIIDSVERMKPTDINTKEGKMELLRRLHIKGVFNVKDAVPYVCSVLSVSQATLYNYLRDLRNEESDTE